MQSELGVGQILESNALNYIRESTSVSIRCLGLFVAILFPYGVGRGQEGLRVARNTCRRKYQGHR